MSELRKLKETEPHACTMLEVQANVYTTGVMRVVHCPVCGFSETYPETAPEFAQVMGETPPWLRRFWWDSR